MRLKAVRSPGRVKHQHPLLAQASRSANDCNTALPARCRMALDRALSARSGCCLGSFGALGVGSDGRGRYANSIRLSWTGSKEKGGIECEEAPVSSTTESRSTSLTENTKSTTKRSSTRNGRVVNGLLVSSLLLRLYSSSANNGALATIFPGKGAMRSGRPERFGRACRRRRRCEGQESPWSGATWST